VRLRGLWAYWDARRETASALAGVRLGPGKILQAVQWALAVFVLTLAVKSTVRGHDRWKALSEQSSNTADMPVGLPAGSRVGTFRLEEQIGQGGMGVVFRATDEHLGRQVAVKVLALAVAADPEFRRRFLRESRAAAKVDHPHIIPVYEADEAGGVLFLAMRYVPSGDVMSMLRRQGPLAPNRAAGIISPVASALDAAHAAGLVHRDVKPANMLLDVQAGRPDHVYLSDFGLAKGLSSADGLTGSGHLWGTPDYMAPEQIEGRTLDGRADQYALACAAFQLLTGDPPFLRGQHTSLITAHLQRRAPALTSRRPGLPSAVDAVFARALSKTAEDRYHSCGEFADTLRAALGLPSYQSGHLSGAAVTRLDHPATPIVGAVATTRLDPAFGKTKTLGSGLPSPFRVDPARAKLSSIEIISRPRPSVIPGDIIAFRSVPEPGIYVLYQDDTAALLAHEATMPDVSPRGDWISYVTNGREFWVVRPDGSDRRLLAELTNQDFVVPSAPRWSPDGSQLAFELHENRGTYGQSESNIYLLDVSTGDFRKLPSDFKLVHGPVTWTAKGDMVVQSYRSLDLLTNIRSEPLCEQQLSDSVQRDPVCSPDGFVVFVEDQKKTVGKDSCGVYYIVRRRFKRGYQRKDFLIGPPSGSGDISSPRILKGKAAIIYVSGGTLYRGSLRHKLAYRARLIRKLALPLIIMSYRIFHTEPRSIFYDQSPVPILDHTSDPVPILHEWKQ
jgi:serine/threonine-protein kinase